jgi:VanZ family protein
MISRRPARRSQIVGVVVLTFYLGVAATVVFWPGRIDGDSRWVYRILYDGYANGLPTWVGYDLVEFLANVLFAVPIGLSLAMILPRRSWWIAVLICCSVFAAVELGQMALPQRVPSLADVIANSIGGLVGAWFWLLLGARSRDRVRG